VYEGYQNNVEQVNDSKKNIAQAIFGAPKLGYPCSALALRFFTKLVKC